MEKECTPYTPPECRDFCDLVHIREDSLSEYTRMLGIFHTIHVVGVKEPSKHTVTKDIRRYIELIQVKPLEKINWIIDLISYLETPFSKTRIDNCYRAILRNFLKHYAKAIQELSPQLSDKLTNMLLDAIYSIASTYILFREEKDKLFSYLKKTTSEGELK